MRDMKRWNPETKAVIVGTDLEEIPEAWIYLVTSGGDITSRALRITHHVAGHWIAERFTPEDTLYETLKGKTQEDLLHSLMIAYVVQI